MKGPEPQGVYEETYDDIDSTYNPNRSQAVDNGEYINLPKQLKMANLCSGPPNQHSRCFWIVAIVIVSLIVVIIGLVVFILVKEYKSEDGFCPPGWQEQGPHCYYFVGHIMLRWDLARRDCIARTNGRGDLASIHDKDMENYMIKAFRLLREMKFWIGLSENWYESDFFWSDYSSLDYLNWRPGSPKKDNDSNDCVSVDSDLGFWKDENCTSYRPYVCKMSKLPTRDVSPLNGPCPSDWLRHREFCYYFSTTEATTWDTAHENCLLRSYGYGDLASIQDKNQDTFIKNNIVSGLSYWLGFIARDRSDNVSPHVWSDSRKVVYLNWDNPPENPDNTKHCTEYLASKKGWKILSCNSIRRYVCKMPIAEKHSTVHVLQTSTTTKAPTTTKKTTTKKPKNTPKAPTPASKSNPAG